MYLKRYLEKTAAETSNGKPASSPGNGLLDPKTIKEKKKELEKLYSFRSGTMFSDKQYKPKFTGRTIDEYVNYLKKVPENYQVKTTPRQIANYVYTAENDAGNYVNYFPEILAKRNEYAKKNPELAKSVFQNPMHLDKEIPLYPSKNLMEPRNGFYSYLLGLAAVNPEYQSREYGAKHVVPHEVLTHGMQDTTIGEPRYSERGNIGIKGNYPAFFGAPNPGWSPKDLYLRSHVETEANLATLQARKRMEYLESGTGNDPDDPKNAYINLRDALKYKNFGDLYYGQSLLPGLMRYDFKENFTPEQQKEYLKYWSERMPLLLNKQKKKTIYPQQRMYS